VIHQPLIRLEEVPFALPEITNYNWIIFTSRFAVEAFLKRASWKFPKVAAIGQLTAAALEKRRIKVDLIPRDESSRGIAAALRRFDLKGKKILIPCSNLSRNILTEQLREQGAVVDKLVVYHNIKNEVEAIDLSGIDEIIFSSPSTVDNFFAIYGELPERIVPIFKGEVTKDEFSKYQA
jgi:uroporphyrinogen-III synthase